MSDFNPEGATQPFGSDGTDVEPVETPACIGRYRIESRLGRGGFGSVFLGYDDQLKRSVAIKVPHPHLVSRPEYAEAYLSEAQTVAGLDHPHIVPVYDVGESSDFPFFVVFKFIAGQTLKDQLADFRPSREEAAEITSTVAKALHYAHKLGLVHRDIKPGNILIDLNGDPFVADFGLALRENEFGKGQCYAGTPAYMSPEQARGEGHRVDGRSDIFSLGTVLYEMIVGRRPFTADSETEIHRRIATQDPKPPRQTDDTIHRELERICLRAMSKRASERYTTARDLADDLDHYLLGRAAAVRVVTSPDVSDAHGQTGGPSVATPPGPSDSSAMGATILPKGLRSFDQHDADFFLQLLPGPRDRLGLPESVRFWKVRIDATVLDKTFTVGLLYGPSGCGKSSLVKAGLLPRLEDHVIPLYMEATPDGTESRLLRELRLHCPRLPDGGLVETMSALRRGHGLADGNKVLIVLDQFEQWLHAHEREPKNELIDALRQCDGTHVQCLLMVRDDFWMSISRFMRHLEIQLLEGQNSNSVDLFSIRHAKKVLIQLGLAHGCLTDRRITAEESEFVSRASRDLADGGRVICVRLAVFAEMMKDRPWTVKSLHEVGGIDGVGVAFLEDTFNSPASRPERRLHEPAATAVLNALLPESGSNLRGNLQTQDALRAVSGYADRPQEFNALLALLDGQLRLITPTRLDGQLEADNDTSSPAENATYYQLTHDYLVPSLREWLSRKRKTTRRGRAELVLSDRSSLWKSKPERRQLPTWLEWIQILAWSRHSDWTVVQRKMMSAATRLHVTTAITVIVAAIAAHSILSQFRSYTAVRALTTRLIEVPTLQVPEIVDQMWKYPFWPERSLKQSEADLIAQGGSYDYGRGLLHVRLAMLRHHPQHADYLMQRLLRGSPDEVRVIRDSLRDYLTEQTDTVWDIVDGDRGHSSAERFRAACALAITDGREARWRLAAGRVAAFVATEPSGVSQEWAALLEPKRDLLQPAFRKLCLGRHDAQQREVAAAVLMLYAGDDLQFRIDLIQQVDPSVLSILSQRGDPWDTRHFATALEDSADQLPPLDSKDDLSVQAHGNLVLASMLVARAVDEWPHLECTPDPTVRTYVLQNMARAIRDPERTMAYLEQVSPDVHGEEACRARMLSLALASYSSAMVPERALRTFVEKTRRLAVDTSDPGLHAALALLLQRWRQEPPTVREEAGLPLPHRRWYRDRFGNTMAVLSASEAGGGGPGDAADVLPARLAIATKETTLRQFVSITGRAGYHDTNVGPTDDCPANNVAVDDAREYCLLLSLKAGILPDQMCYRRTDTGEIVETEHFLRRSGYRLPTPFEWETVCRAGTSTATHFGEGLAWANRYAWTRDHAVFSSTSNLRTFSVGSLLPNDYGLFDMYGNVSEWCVDHRLEAFKCGGTYYSIARDVNSGLRVSGVMSPRTQTVGFRICRTMVP